MRPASKKQKMISTRFSASQLKSYKLFFLVSTILLVGVIGINQSITSKPYQPLRKLQQHLPPVKLLVGAYYYPWYNHNFHSGGGYVRANLGQGPTLGEYDDTNPATIRQHLAWSNQANIGLWITSWWGPQRPEDTTTKNVILPLLEGTSHKFCLLYESLSRLSGPNGTTTTDNIASDIDYMAQTYFNHPNYYKISGKPVIVLYVTRTLDNFNGFLEDAILAVRQAAIQWGYDIYIVGDHAFGPASIDNTIDGNVFTLLDAVTNYDVYGSLGRGYVGQANVDKFYDTQSQWKILANQQQCGFIPSVTPGYNDRGVRLEANHLPLSRRLAPTSPEGSLFAALLTRAVLQVDASADNLIIVNSFNEWHEDTQIEPCVGITTTKPYNMTLGLEYTGYGDLYLNILSNMTTNATVKASPILATPVPLPVATVAPSSLL